VERCDLEKLVGSLEEVSRRAIEKATPRNRNTKKKKETFKTKN